MKLESALRGKAWNLNIIFIYRGSPSMLNVSHENILSCNLLFKIRSVFSAYVCTMLHMCCAYVKVQKWLVERMQQEIVQF